MHSAGTILLIQSLSMCGLCLMHVVLRTLCPLLRRVHTHPGRRLQLFLTAAAKMARNGHLEPNAATKYAGLNTLPKTNTAPDKMASQRKSIFQPFISGAKMLVSGRVHHNKSTMISMISDQPEHQSLWPLQFGSQGAKNTTPVLQTLGTNEGPFHDRSHG